MCMRKSVMATLCLFLLAGCGGGIQSLSFSPLEPRPSFLVEMKTQKPDQPTRVVSQSFVAVDPGGDMQAVPSSEHEK